MRARTLLLTTAVCFAFTSGMPASGGAVAIGYEYVVVADSADGFDPFEFGCAALNESGQVAFRTASAPGRVQLVLRGEGADLTTIADERDGDADFLGRNPSINAFGQVSFAGSRNGGEAIFKGDGDFLRVVASTRGEFRFFGFDTSISDSGRVAFKAELDNNDQGLFSAQRVRRPHTEYLASETEFLGDQSGPSIALRSIAFSETRDDFTGGIFRIDGDGAVTTIVDDSGPVGFADNPSSGQGGEVAFHVFLDSGGEAIMVGDGGPVTTIADTSGRFSGFGFETPSLSAAGDIAFIASLDGVPSGATGLFVNSASNIVVLPGDALAGSAVANVVACGEALNAVGQVAFQAQLEDGRTVIVRADPAG